MENSVLTDYWVFDDIILPSESYSEAVLLQ